MRALLFSVVLAFAGLQAAQAPQAGTTVCGQVVRQETSAPIPDVQIMLAQLNPALPQDSETMRYVQGLVSLLRNPNAGMLMNKGGLIGGRVRDTEGKVIGGVTVEALELQYPGGRVKLAVMTHLTAHS